MRDPLREKNDAAWEQAQAALAAFRLGGVMALDDVWPVLTEQARRIAEHMPEYVTAHSRLLLAKYARAVHARAVWYPNMEWTTTTRRT
jgi:hypothetical protein